VNDEAPLPGRPDTYSITAAEDTTASGSSYPRCESCGDRFPSIEFLERHRIRACIGPVGDGRIVCVRLPREERTRFARRLRNMS